MMDFNIVGSPVEFLECVIPKNSSDTFVTRGSLTFYFALMPKRVYSVSGLIPIASFTKSYNNSTGFFFDSRYKEEATFTYSGSSVLQLSKTNDVNTAFVYGADKSLPIAQITNATHAQAIALVNQAILDNPSSDAALRTELNKLRTGLPGAQVTTYTYAPLIGITSQTDPNGRTTTYEYDAFGRLLRIKDHDGNTIKQMDYQYQKPVTN
jgi:YD repeat-containing protein